MRRECVTFDKVDAPHDAPNPSNHKNGGHKLQDGGQDTDDEGGLPSISPILGLAATQDRQRRQ
jgi:hypothetical protein